MTQRDRNEIDIPPLKFSILAKYNLYISKQTNKQAMHQLLPSNLQSFIIIKYSSTHALPLFHTAFLAALCFFDAISYNFFCFFCSSFFLLFPLLLSPLLHHLLLPSSHALPLMCSSTHALRSERLFWAARGTRDASPVSLQW